MYITICPGSKRDQRDGVLDVKFTNAAVESQVNWPLGMLLVEPFPKRLNFRGEVSSNGNPLENPKMEDVDQLSPLRELVVHGCAWQQSPQEAVGSWSGAA